MDTFLELVAAAAGILGAAVLITWVVLVIRGR